MPSGTQVTSFGVATNRVWRDKAGAKKEETQFHNVVTFGRQAEVAGQYLRKGGSVLVEGRIQTRSWDAPDGLKKSRRDIVAERIQLGPKSGSSSLQQAGSQSSPARQETPVPVIEYPEEEIDPEAIPF